MRRILINTSLQLKGNTNKHKAASSDNIPENGCLIILFQSFAEQTPLFILNLKHPGNNRCFCGVPSVLYVVLQYTSGPTKCTQIKGVYFTHTAEFVWPSSDPHSAVKGPIYLACVSIHGLGPHEHVAQLGHVLPSLGRLLKTVVKWDI